MEFRILGPLEVCADGRTLALGGARPGAVLAVLLLHAGEPMSAERLALALWGEEAPEQAVKTLQVHVSRLRKALGDRDVLATTPGGYRLTVRPDEIDVHRFERQVAEGRQALAEGRPERAADVLHEALALWRGPPLDEFGWAPFAAAETARLEEMRLAALELRVDADLAAGRHGELVAELQQLTARHPWREHLHGQSMLALYRSGRQADALEAYRHARDVLVEQLGIEPGPELRDLHQAMLVHDPGLDAPPAAASPAPERRSALPVPPNPTIGRAADIRAIGERLRAGSVRLLTLTGPGGVGKTRLALEAAHAVAAHFADGTHFVSLAAVERSQDVAAAIVNSLGIIPLAGESAEEAVERFHIHKHLLLVVDNCEHLPAAAPFIAGLPARCPAVSVLATSREPLSVHAEQRYPVPQLAGVDGVALFCERARAHDPRFELGDANADAVAEICRRLDGLPLAIELAAARCGLLSPGEIAGRLDAVLGALGAGPRDAPARQHTLRTTIDWSHDLLSAEERACFARFAAFAGGATVQAAEAITGAGIDTLDRLVAKSLLVRRRPAIGPTRLGMLETIRAYAGERFAAVADREPVRERHYRYFLALAQRHGNQQAVCGADRQAHLTVLDGEVANLQAALQWAIEQETAEAALELCVPLGDYWLMRERYATAVEWIERALNKSGAEAAPALRARLLSIEAWALWPFGRGAERRAVLAEAEAIARTLVDPVILSLVLLTRAVSEGWTGRLDAGRRLADEALSCARTAGDQWALALAAWARAVTAGSAELHERVDQAAALLAEAGNVYHLADVYHWAAHAALLSGHDRDAQEFVDRGSPLAREIGDPMQWAQMRGKSGLLALFGGDTEGALEAFREQLRICRELVVLTIASQGLGGLAALAVLQDDLDRAARLSGAAATHRYEADDRGDARLRATFFDPARTRCGAETWDAAAREGAALSFNDAIAYALEDVPTPEAALVRSLPEALD